MSRPLRVAAFLAVCAAFLATAGAVDKSKFRTCKDAAFCRRHRDKKEFEHYFMDLTSVKTNEGSIGARLTGGPSGSPPLALEARFFESGVARVHITEATDAPPRWEAPDVVLEEQQRETSVAVSRENPGVPVPSDQGESLYVSYQAGNGANVVVVFHGSPFRVDMYRDNVLVLTANGAGQFHFEHRRSRADAGHAVAADGAAQAGEEKKIVDWGEDGKPIYEDGSVGAAEDTPVDTPADANANAGDSEDESGMWRETFGGHTDSKPHGPTSISMDIEFPGADNVYGIPEHASSMALKETTGGSYNEPYRLYNLDVFEYELDVPMALYGAIPVMYGHSTEQGGRTAGAFWNNPTETYIDLNRDSALSGWKSRWISESGVVDLMLMPGGAPVDVFSQFTSLVGTQALPPIFALGYNQCRWNYKDEADVAAVDAKFEEHNFPYDVLWLDIEHTDGKRYFTWDKPLFPNPAEMQNKLAERGRKMVTIIDPHIKRDPGYHIHSEAQREGLYIKNKDGGEFDGWCWPGASSYLDFTDGKVRSWWADRFSLDSYAGSTLNLFTWNDMNEPSVFNGPEVSMPKDALSLAGVEHREWHNLYGFYHQMATAEGLVRRSPNHNSRPFVLTRSFYAGSQRNGAMWTGDNAARWDHLQIAAPMLLSVSLGGLSFAGADVGGFFGNPDSELLERWYQAGSFQPFFRAHAHIDTKRREPWLFGDETLGRLRDTVRARYALMPFWYTQFYHASVTGAPVMRPLWAEYPGDKTVLTMDDQWTIGSDLLVKPATAAGQTTVSVYIPGSDRWFDVQDYTPYNGGLYHSVEAPLHKIPVFQRAGSIVPRQQRPRRCTKLMRRDPYTLVVALDNSGQASGSVYLDDGETFDHQRGKFRLIQLDFNNRVLSASLNGGDKSYAPENVVERIVVVGLGGEPSTVSSAQSDGAPQDLAFVYDASKDVLTVRKPGVKIAYDFQLRFN